jgi:hypothetical protein
MSFPVAINTLAVPDDLDAAGNLKLTVQVSPFSSSGRDTQVDLSDWPALIAAAAPRMVVEFAATVGSTVVSVECGSALCDYFMQNGEWLDLPNQLWKRIFLQGGFGPLHEAVTTNAFDLAGSRPKQVSCSQVSDLSEVMHALCDPLPMISKDPRALRTFQSRRAKLIDAWLGPVTRTGGSARTLKDIDTARHSMQERTERSRRLLGLSQAIHAHLIRGDALSDEHLSSLHGVLGNLLHGLGMDEAAARKRHRRGSADPHVVSDLDIAKHRLQAIQCIPRLAHYLSLGIQLRLDFNKVPPLREGVLRVRFLDGLEQNNSWTAFEYADRQSSPPGHFGPLANPNAGASRYKLKEGLLLLSEPGRFRLDTIDAVNMLFRAIQERLAGDPKDTISKLDKIRRGFALMDREKKQHDEEQASEEEEEQKLGFVASRVFHSEDLMIGFRPDVAIAEPGGTSLAVKSARWRPLTRRQIVCEGQYFDPAFSGLPVMQEIAHHDHGWTASPRRVDQSTTDEELFTWAGGSLAVAAFAGTAKETASESVLSLGVTYQLDNSDPSQQLPPLREDHAYVVGCRAAYLGGAGPTFESARERYGSQPELVIGSGQTPMVFPAGSTQPCSVHFLRDDPLVRWEDIADLGCESLTRLVIRGAGEKGDRARRRVVLPARVDFDAAELERQFDSEDQRKLGTPLGICSRAPLHLQLFEESAQLPEARAGRLWRQKSAEHGESIKWVDLENGSVVDEQHLPALRGSVALFATYPNASTRQFYASRHGRSVQPRLILTTAGEQGSLLVNRDIEFWAPNSTPCNGTPVVIELAEASENANQDSVEWDQFDLGGSTVPLLRVKLRPASSARLVLDERRPDIAGEAVIRTQSLELIHAVVQPHPIPIVPDQPASTTAGDPLGVHSVTLPPGKSVEDSQMQWQSYVANHPVASMLEWPSAPEGTVTYFVGALNLHRASTGRVAVSMQWEEFDESRIVRNPAVRGAVDILQGHKPWIHCAKNRSAPLQEMEVGEFGEADVMSLLRDESKAGNAQLRELRYAFPDGRARQLQLKAVATSRFAHCYAPGTDVVVTQPQLTTIWTACTFRPPPPQLEVITTDLDWTSEWLSTNGPRVVTRANRRLRISLDAGWYASGEGEQLGILLKPAGVVEANIPESHRPYLSRFAGDPVRTAKLSGECYLTPADLLNTAVKPGVEVVVSKSPTPLSKVAGDTPLSPVLLDVLPLEPVVDPLTGGLVCEIELKDQDLGAPMLHLGLVRYQPHAIEGLCASTPILEVVYLQPSRQLVVVPGDAQHSGDPQYRTVTLRTPEQHGESGITHVPREMEVRLLLRNANKGWDQWRPTDNTPAHFRQRLPSAPSHTFTVKLPRRSVPVALMIEEYELLSSDATSSHSNANTAQGTSDERRPLFWFLVHIGTQEKPA